MIEHNTPIQPSPEDCIIITAGSAYLDIDAYACSIALRELLCLQGAYAIAYSTAPCNYSVTSSLVEDGQMLNVLPADVSLASASYVIVDVSDPDFIKSAVPLDRIKKVYDHHTGFESYWDERIGQNAHIEFIGAAATLIWREWKNAALQDKISRASALLLIAAILDNTLNLTSSNTTDEDRKAFFELCRKANVGEDFCDAYFSEVQGNVEKDLQNALFKDIKRNRIYRSLPPRIAQLCIWDAERIFHRLPDIRTWFDDGEGSFMINIIDIKHRCSYFVCDDQEYQKEIEAIFYVSFERGVARSATSYLRKQIIKKVAE